MNIVEVAQGTDEWKAARCGKLTASRIPDVVRKTKSGVSASRATMAGVLIAERLSKRSEEGFTSAAMQWGKDNEAQARATYSILSDGAEIKEVGFVLHPRIVMAGASPDGLVGHDGLVEIKCPLSATHIKTLLTEAIDPDYILQMQWQMACTGRDWCDFVSFDPRLPPEMSIFVRRVGRDRETIATLEHEAERFLAEIEETVSRLNAKFGRIAA